MGKFLKRVWSALFAVAISLVLSGCAGTIERPDGSTIALNSKEFRAYVGSVFRYQNGVADALAFTAVDLDSAVHPKAVRRLETAEEKLLEACSGLNELATATRDGERLGVFRKRTLARQVPNCQRAADLAQQLLAEFEFSP